MPAGLCSCSVLTVPLSSGMPDPDEKLTPADPEDLTRALAFALRFEGRKRWHDADELMANIVAEAADSLPRARPLRHYEAAAAWRAFAGCARIWAEGLDGCHTAQRVVTATHVL